MNPEHGKLKRGSGSVKKAVTQATSFLRVIRDRKKGVKYEHSSPTDEEWVAMKETLTQEAFEAEVALAAKESSILLPAYLEMVERKVAAWKMSHPSDTTATAGVPTAEITMEFSDVPTTPLGSISEGQNPEGLFSRGAPDDFQNTKDATRSRDTGVPTASDTNISVSVSPIRKVDSDSPTKGDTKTSTRPNGPDGDLSYCPSEVEAIAATCFDCITDWDIPDDLEDEIEAQVQAASKRIREFRAFVRDPHADHDEKMQAIDALMDAASTYSTSPPEPTAAGVKTMKVKPYDAIIPTIKDVMADMFLISFGDLIEEAYFHATGLSLIHI